MEASEFDNRIGIERAWKVAGWSSRGSISERKKENLDTDPAVAQPGAGVGRGVDTRPKCTIQLIHYDSP